MYICKDCGEVFETPLIKYPLNGSRAEEDCEEVCPVCGGTYTEAEQCPRCGGWHEGFTSFCPDCMEYIGECMRDLFSMNGTPLEGSARDDMEYEVKQWIEQNW